MTHPKTIVKQNPHYAQSQKIMFDLRVTRWAEDLYGYSMFLATLLHLLLEHLQVIRHKLRAFGEISRMEEMRRTI